MSVYPPYLLGAALGLSALVVARGLFPPPPPLRRTLARFASGPARRPPPGGPLPERLGTALARRLGDGVPRDRLEADLRITGRTLPRHAFDKLATATALAALPTITATLAAGAGAGVSLTLVAVATLVLGVAGFVVPDLTLRQEAESRRREFRFALSAYLNLVAIIVAAGGGVEGALFDAAKASDSWAFTELSRALAPCRFSAETPWRALAALGDALGVKELRALAGATGLAGEHGAKVRASIAGQARALRRKLLRDIHREAEATTERMAVPVVGLFFGFLIVIGYPAVARVVTGL